MRYAGLDVHKEFIYANVVDDNGTTVFERKFMNSVEALDYFLGSQEKETSFVLEACGMFEPVYDRIESQGFSVKVAHPLKTRAIASARIKTDSIDAKVLANLLRTDLVAESYVPNKEVRDLRCHVRRRASLVRQRSHLKHQSHSILLKNGINAPMTDIFGVSGKKFLQQVELPFAERLALDNLLAIVESFDERISLSDTAIKGIVQNNPTIKRLTTIPGVGDFSALLVYSEIDDIKRFKSPKQLCSYAGIVPSVYQSGNTVRRGSITKQGSRLLRWILVQAAHKSVVSDPHLSRFYNHLVKKKGANKAIIAVARKMLTYIHIMLTEGIEYQSLCVNRKETVKHPIVH